MDVFEAVRTILAVRRYQDRAVPEEVLHRIIEAGRLTASSMNLQPWHFVVVQDRDTLRQLGARARTGPYIAQAPLAIVVAIAKSRFAVSDASRAIQSMLLTAWADGVGSNWVGFGGLENVKALLGIPAELEVLAILPFGYPAEAVGQGKKNRKPLTQVAHRERYGQPFQQEADRTAFTFDSPATFHTRYDHRVSVSARWAPVSKRRLPWYGGASAPGARPSAGSSAHRGSGHDAQPSAMRWSSGAGGAARAAP